MEDFLGELDALRAENIRLRNLLRLTEEQARAAAPDQTAVGTPVDMQATPEAKVRFYLDLFRCRSDTYAVRWENRQDGRTASQMTVQRDGLVAVASACTTPPPDFAASPYSIAVASGSAEAPGAGAVSVAVPCTWITPLSASAGPAVIATPAAIAPANIVPAMIRFIIPPVSELPQRTRSSQNSGSPPNHSQTFCAAVDLAAPTARPAAIADVAADGDRPLGQVGCGDADQRQYSSVKSPGRLA
ncbi:hypothetical protein [Nocardia terpenica]|uniref:Uncharacterized protein n=1 Tax=Nocardia terpenica TaxID=455432 RepID=A0A6G9Z735_9NOCA|nr:hypothetical protein [Nocardia terpenica]QIS21167.1 hypothetical protein F6W96_25420 [Nocardia terpenica]